MEKEQDSKVSRTFLRKVLKCLGRNTPKELAINSWEMYDVIAKDISIILRDLERAKGNIRNLMSSDNDRRQFTIKAIGDFYDKNNGKRRKGEQKKEEMERQEEDKVEQLAGDQ